MEPIKYSSSFLRRIAPKQSTIYTSDNIELENPNYDTFTEYNNLINRYGYSDAQAIEWLNRNLNKYPDYYSVYAGQFPEVVITPKKNTRNEVLLTTYYPGTSKYWMTGHSTLHTPGGNSINVMSDDPGYNLLLNNCSDATREALEYATGKKMNPWFFTTPGDVRSFAEDILYGKSFDNGDGSVETRITLPLELINKIAQYARDLRTQKIQMIRNRAEKLQKPRMKQGPYKNMTYYDKK